MDENSIRFDSRINYSMIQPPEDTTYAGGLSANYCDGSLTLLLYYETIPWLVAALGKPIVKFESLQNGLCYKTTTV